MSNPQKFQEPAHHRSKKGKNAHFAPGIPAETMDQENSIIHTAEDPSYIASTRENNRKLALLECLIRDKDSEIKRISHEHQLNLTQLTSQVDYYKTQYNSMMDELQEVNRAMREENLDLTTSYEQAVIDIHNLRARMKMEKDEFCSRERKCEELLIKNQKDSSQSKRELSKLEERSNRLEKDLLEARAKGDALGKELIAKSRTLAALEGQLQLLNGEKQSLDGKLNDALKDNDIYKGYLSAIEKDFHSAFPRSSRPNSDSKSFRYEWLVTTMRDVILQFILEHQQLQANYTIMETERELLKNEHMSVHNMLMREISLLHPQNHPSQNSTNSKLLHILNTSFRESLQSAEIVMLEKTQDNEFLSKEISNLQSYIISLKQDKEDLQLSNTRLEQGNKKSLEHINSLQKEMSNLKKLDVSRIMSDKCNPFYSESEIGSFGASSNFSPPRGREVNSVMEKAIQEISNLERDKMFLQTQVDNLSRKVKSNQLFQSTPTHTSSSRRMNSSL